MFQKVLILLFLFACHVANASGTPHVEVLKESQHVQIECMEQYIDTASVLTYKDFMDHRHSFLKPAKKIQGTRNRKFTYWLSFTLEGQAMEKDDYVLICTDNRISSIRFWLDGKPTTKEPMGTDFPFSNREVDFRNFVTDLPQSVKHEIVIKIQSDQSTFFTFQLKTRNQFYRDSYFENIMLGCCYGILILGFFFSLVMRIKFKEDIYWTYPIFALVATLISFYIDGSGFQYIWPDHPQLNIYLLLLLPIALMISLGLLTLAALDELRIASPFFKIVMGGILYAQIGYLFVFTMPEYFIHNIFYILPFLIMIAVCIQKYRLGYKSVLAYIFGFVFILAANLTYSLQPFFAAKYTNNVIQFSPHIGVIALAMSLTYSQFIKFFQLNRQSIVERKNAIKHLEQLNQIKDRINEEIAIKVDQQTKELENKSAVIQLQNRKLKEINDQLKEQSDKIIALNLELNQENLELKTNVKKITESRILQNTIPFDEFKNYFNDDRKCYDLLEIVKWQNGFQCAKCGNKKYSSGKGERARRCTKCGTNESITANTIFHRLHFPITKGFYILFLVNKHGENLISKDLSELVDLRLATCWKLRKKILSKKQQFEQEGVVVKSWMDLI